MFGKLKKVDGKLFWLVMGIAALWLIISLLGAPESPAYLIMGIVFIIGCLLDYYIAGLFYFLGVDKGYNSKVYLWIATLLPPAGYLLIVAMPDRGSNLQVANDDLPDL